MGSTDPPLIDGARWEWGRWTSGCSDRSRCGATACRCRSVAAASAPSWPCSHCTWGRSCPRTGSSRRSGRTRRRRRRSGRSTPTCRDCARCFAPTARTHSSAASRATFSSSILPTWTPSASSAWSRKPSPRWTPRTPRPPTGPCGRASTCGGARRWPTSRTSRSPPPRGDDSTNGASRRLSYGSTSI